MSQFYKYSLWILRSLCRQESGLSPQAVKALKQSCKIKTFVGTSANALKTQIWTALIAMLLVKILHMKSTYGWHFSNFMVLLRQQMFVYRDLWKWIDDPFQAPETPPTPQLELAFC